MTVSKKVLSVFMSLILVLGLLPALQVVPATAYAADQAAEQVEQQGSNKNNPDQGDTAVDVGEDGAADKTIPGKDTVDTPAQDGIQSEQDKSDVSSGTSVDGNNSAESDTEAPDAGVDVEATVAEIPETSTTPPPSTLDSLAYVLIERSEVPVGEEQNIVISFNDEEFVPERATLIVVNLSGSKSFTFEAETETPGAVRFKIEPNALKAGFYQLASLELTSAGQTATIPFETDEANSYFFAITDESGAVDLSSYAIDEEGDLTEKDTVESALTEAENAQAVNSVAASGRALLSNTATTSELVVALDPGHGGSDPGALGNGLQEKTLNLSIARYAREELQQYDGVRVVMTRDSDVYVGLTDRVTNAVAQGADVFVSIHLNSSTNTSANGAEVIVPNQASWFYNEAHVAGTQLGEKILAQLVSLGLAERSVYWRDATNDERFPDGSLSDYFTVINASHDAGIPGIIVEHAFISNPSDAAFLGNEANLKALGVADATGIAQQYGLVRSDYWAVYSYEYYIEHHPDVAAAYGNNQAAVFNHFIEYGMVEGRQASPVFDVSYYQANNADLNRKFGDDYSTYYEHFMNYGMREGRQGSAEFDAVSYYNANADLRVAFGNTSTSYYRHYIDYGYKEQRTTTGVSSITKYTTTHSGTNWSAVYDGAYYSNNNRDVRVASTVKLGQHSVLSDLALLQHFMNYGMREGRQGSAEFDAVSYYNANADLRVAFGNTSTSYYRHYIDYGYKEQRTTTGVSSITKYTTTHSGTNWSAVYDGAYYSNNNRDVRVASTVKLGQHSVLSDLALLQHFMNYGMREGRQGNENFDVRSYYNEYPDLRSVFGNNYPLYYQHYVQYGKNEGRNGTGCTTLVPGGTAIMGPSQASVAQMAARFNATGHPYPSSVYASRGAATIEQFCTILLEEANAEGVRAEVVFCQAMKETGWLQFGGDVRVEQCNFAGLGATGGGAGGATFPDVRTGIRAHVQHLKCYASTAPLVYPLVDPRWDNAVAAYGRGSAPYLENLDGKWAVPGVGYGESIASMITQLLAY